VRRLLVPLALVLVSTACSSSSDSPTVTAPTTSATTSATSSSTTGATDDATTIRIKGFAYNALTVAPGTTITVKNFDEATHTVTSKTAGQFDTGNVDQDQTATFKAPDKAGAYEFVCTIHASMKGTLTVS
jgi:plastocyanin